MKKKKESKIKYYINKFKNRDIKLEIVIFLFLVFGTLMIVSASMGEHAGDFNNVSRTFFKQLIIISISYVSYLFFMLKRQKGITVKQFQYLYVLFLGSVIITRFSGSYNGAYGWIRLGPLSIQPSEFCKVFMIFYGSRLFSVDNKKHNITAFKLYGIEAIVMVLVILLWQKDTGSAFVLAGICYMILMVPAYKELTQCRFWLFVGLFIIFVGIGVIMVPQVNDFLSRLSDSYMIKRFTAAANPFEYQYDSGYHLVMSLVSMASGGWFGVGYGKSLHKYMNFPNPTNDFILPIIIEELGVIGLLALFILYIVLMAILMNKSLKTKRYSSCLIFFGTVVYLMLHFVLNVGGVSGLIPLTGVPLLFISSGGSSTMAIMIALGLCQYEIIRGKSIKDR